MTSSSGTPQFPFTPRQGARPAAPTPTPEEAPQLMSPDLAVPPSSSTPGAGSSVTRTDIPDFQQIGPYSIHSKIGRGGMGWVYLGLEPGSAQYVAVKVMKRELVTDRDAVHRFQREARAAESIQHPNVARILSAGETEDGLSYMAMEYIGGGTMENVIRQRLRLPYSHVAGLMIQAAEALEYARKLGIIHRDIKPANLMLNEHWQVKVVDFGLAKFFHEDSFRTMAGSILGTPRYMSPEQSQGREVDYRSDIYSLGATFYHVLTGRAPFDGNSPTQIMMKHVTAPLVPMRSINPEVPMEFDDIIRKCMAKDPIERYQDYIDLISQLSHLRLQWANREQSSLHGQSVYGMPTVHLDAAGNPMPPTGPSRSTRTIKLEEYPEEDGRNESIPIWIYLLGLLLGIMVIGFIGALLTIPLSDKSSRGKSDDAGGSAYQRILTGAAEERERIAKSPPVARVGPLEATIDMMKDLAKALGAYEYGHGEAPASLATLIDEKMTLLTYELDYTGEPLDAWGNRFTVDGVEMTIRSRGADGVAHSGDDLVAGTDARVRVNFNYYNEMSLGADDNRFAPIERLNELY